VLAGVLGLLVGLLLAAALLLAGLLLTAALLLLAGFLLAGILRLLTRVLVWIAHFGSPFQPNLRQPPRALTGCTERGFPEAVLMWQPIVATGASEPVAKTILYKPFC
jgi:hypothetical protein